MNAVLEYPQRHPISAEEYLRMGESGVFAPEARLELIEGEIIEMARIGSPHAGTVMILNRLFSGAARDSAIVLVQGPLIIGGKSVCQPDLALLRPRSDSYTRSHPAAADVLLVVEVSDATLTFDLKTKVPLYARAGIVEAWVVDLNGHVVRVFRDPDASGYRTSFTVAKGREVSAVAFPAVSVAVAAVFPE